MTTRQRLAKELTDRGMSDSQAEEVMKLAIPRINAIVPDYQIPWDSPEDHYNSTMFKVWTLELFPVALEWIEANKPLAWFKPLFK